MLIEIDPEDRRPLYWQIADEIRRAIAAGTVGVEQPLPAVRHLARDLRVNPNTVQQAYRLLERDGIVEVRRGRGTFVRAGRGGGLRRQALGREIAARALREAYRHGLSAKELIGALRELAPKR